MTELEKRQKLTSFFNALFSLEQGEYIRVFMKREEETKQKYFDDIDVLVDFIFEHQKANEGYNYYFNLATTNGKGGKTENLISRSFIGLDIDFKDFNGEIEYTELIGMFKRENIKYSIIVSTGNGYHVYVKTDKTKDLNKVEELTKCFAYKLGADENACLKTQVLRIPFTFNCKDNKRKHCNIVYQYENIFEQKIDTLSKQHITEKYKAMREQNIDTQNKLFYADRVLPCVKALIQNGETKGNRQDGLKKIVCNLKNIMSLEEVLECTKEYGQNCIPEIPERELDYQTRYLFDNVNYVDYGCKYCNCDTKQYCFKNVANNEFKFKEDDFSSKIEISDKAMKSITKKNKPRKGVRTSMEGNNLIVYCMLLYKQDYFKQGLSVKMLLNEFKYLNKNTLSDSTLRASLRELEEKKLIEVKTIEREKYYKSKNIRAKEDYKFILSAAALMEAVKERITAQEFRIYGYMRYRLNEDRRAGKCVLSGNVIRIEQQEIAKELGTDQAFVSRAIAHLIEERIIDMYDVKLSKSTNYNYNVYMLNY